MPGSATMGSMQNALWRTHREEAIRRAFQTRYSIEFPSRRGAYGEGKKEHIHSQNKDALLYACATVNHPETPITAIINVATRAKNWLKGSLLTFIFSPCSWLFITWQPQRYFVQAHLRLHSAQPSCLLPPAGRPHCSRPAREHQRLAEQEA